MANIVNINAEIGANMIGDDAQPTLQFSNTSTGPGLKTDSFVATSSATIVGAELVGQAAVRSAATLTRAALITRTTYGSPSVALMAVGVSGASIPVLELLGHSFTSAVSIVFAASANWAGLGAVRVKLSDGTTYGWLPVLPDGVVTAAVYS